MNNGCSTETQRGRRDHGAEREREDAAFSASSPRRWGERLRRAPLLGVVLALILTLSVSGVASATGTETITGTVVNGTAKAPIPNGLVVTLQGTGSSQQPTFSQSTSVSPDGRFTFANVPADPNVSYTISTDYAGVPYSTAVPKANGQSTIPAELKIYEPTTSDSAIRVDSASWLLGALDAEKQQTTILVLLTVTNAGDRVYVGDHRGDPGAAVPGVLPRTLRLALPQGASDFQPQMGLDPSKLLPIANGYVDTEPLLPGQHQLAYTYRLGYAEGIAEIRVDLPYPTTKLRFLAPDVGLEFRSDRLGDGGTMPIEGRTYRVLAADQLKADTTVTIDVIGLPGLPTNRLDPTTIQIAGLVLIGLAIILAAFLGLQSRGSSQTDPLAQRRALLVSIAQLDDRFAAGQISAERYQAERARQKQQLIDLIMGSRAFPTGSGAA
jgi:hypothetical protein